MARVSKTSPFRVRSHAEVRANTNTDSEKKDDTPSEPIPEEENSSSSTSDEEGNSSSSTSDEEGNSSSSTSDEEENSSSSTSDEEENDHEKGKGKRPMKRKVRKQQIRSVIGLSYSPGKAKEVRKLDAAFKRKASAAKRGRGRGRGRGRPTKESSVNVGSNAERKRKGKEKETDVFELSDTELEEVYKKFRMKGNDDDDSGEDGGGAGIGAQNLSSQVY